MFKLDIGDPKSKRTVHLETAGEAFLGRKIGDKIEGKEIPEVKEFDDYEFILTGASTKAGLPALANVETVGLKRVLLTRGKALKAKKPKGLRKKRTVHGNTISEDIMQINLKVSKEGAKPFTEIFKKPEEAKPEVKVEEKKEETKE
jgi:small subunit ribosomal protein S6e